MNPKTTRTVAKFIAILLVVALAVTSFSFVFFWAGTPAVVYAASADEPDWNRELLRFRDFMIQTKGAYKDDIPYKVLIDGAYEGIIDSSAIRTACIIVPIPKESSLRSPSAANSSE